MKPKHLLVTALFALCLFFLSCGRKDKKQGDDKTIKTETTSGDDGAVPKIDTAALRDEASILDAMQKVADATIADEKKNKENPDYSGHYLELMKLHTAVLKASTADASQAVEFGKRFSEIENKMYAK
jgi:hypothetical protein